MLDLLNNKQAFLKEKPKIGFIVTIVMTIILLMLLIYICQREVYDNYQTKGIVSCNEKCTITTVIPSNLNFEQVVVNNKNIHYEIIGKELRVDEKNYLSYYDLTLSTSLSFSNNEIVDLTFYYNKQRIITKIKDKMF